MKSLIEDLKSGKNFELYVIFLLGIIFAILGFYSKVKFEILSSVILAVLSLLAFGALKTRRQVDNLNLQTNSLNEKITSVNLNQSIERYGIKHVYKSMPYSEFYKRIDSSKTKKVRILQTWLKGTNPITDEMIEAIERGVEFELILLKPDSSIAAMRTADIGLEQNSTRAITLFEGIKAAVKNKKINQEKFKVRFHDRLPPFSMYAVDDWIIIGLYWHGRGSVANPMIQLDSINKGKYGWNVMDTFEEIWNKSEEYNFN